MLLEEGTELLLVVGTRPRDGRGIKRYQNLFSAPSSYKSGRASFRKLLDRACLWLSY